MNEHDDSITPDDVLQMPAQRQWGTDHASRLAMLTAHLDALWPVAWRDTARPRTQQYFLVRSHPEAARPRQDSKPPWRSNWHRLPSDLDHLAHAALRQSHEWDDYYGVNLGRATCHADPKKRLKTPDILVVPGLLGDWDGGWGVHKAAAHLPDTPEALLAFLHTLPTPPTIIIDTGGGFHTYHLFPEPWVLATPAERATAEQHHMPDAIMSEIAVLEF